MKILHQNTFKKNSLAFNAYQNPKSVISDLNQTYEIFNPNGSSGGLNAVRILGAGSGFALGTIAGPGGMAAGVTLGPVIADAAVNLLSRNQATSHMKGKLQELGTDDMVNLAEYLQHDNGLIEINPLAARAVRGYCKQELPKVSKALNNPNENYGVGAALKLRERSDALTQLADACTLPAKTPPRQWVLNNAKETRYVDTII